MQAFFLERIYRNLLAVFPLFFPLYLMKFSVFGIPFTVLEVATYFLFCLHGVLFYRKHKGNFLLGEFQKFRFNKNFFTSITPLIICFLLAAFLGTIVAEDYRIALGIFKGWIVAPLLFFIMLRSFASDKEFYEKLLDYYILSAFLLSLTAIFQVFTDSYLTIDERASGPFASANYLAMYLAPAFSIGTVKLFSLLSDCKTLLKKFLLISEFIIIGSALFFTQSYAAFISVFLALGVYLLYRYRLFAKNFVRNFVLFFLILAIFFLGFWLFSGDNNKFRNIFNFKEKTSSAVRMETWTVAFGLIRERPIFGIGLGQFEKIYEREAERFLSKIPYESKVLHPHNLYLTLWLYMGIFGLIVFLRLIYLSFSRCSFLQPKFLQLYLGGILLLVVILAHGFFDTTFFKNDLAYVFWLSMALTRL